MEFVFFRRIEALEGTESPPSDQSQKWSWAGDGGRDGGRREFSALMPKSDGDSPEFGRKKIKKIPFFQNKKIRKNICGKSCLVGEFNARFHAAAPHDLFHPFAGLPNRFLLLLLLLSELARIIQSDLSIFRHLHLLLLLLGGTWGKTGLPPPSLLLSSTAEALTNSSFFSFQVPSRRPRYASSKGLLGFRRKRETSLCPSSGSGHLGREIPFLPLPE